MCSSPQITQQSAESQSGVTPQRPVQGWVTRDGDVHLRSRGCPSHPCSRRKGRRGALTSLASRGLLPGLRETWASGWLLNVPHSCRPSGKLAAGLRAQSLLSRAVTVAVAVCTHNAWETVLAPLRPLGHRCCRGRRVACIFTSNTQCSQREA